MDNRFTGPTARTVELGGTSYTLSLVGFDPPTGYGNLLAGGITARVSVGDAAAPPEPPAAPPANPATTPEPGTALLAALGLPIAAATRAARRRQGDESD